jgi:aldehyde dehydrogenase (NAD+)
MSDIAVAPAPTPVVLPTDRIQEVFRLQQQHQMIVARTGVAERKAKLWRLHDAMLRYQKEIQAAMYADFGKSETEVDLTEIGVVNSEIRHTIRNLSSWMTPKQVSTPLMLVGTRSEIRYEPKGVCLIISPWNFPFNLTFAPLVSAIAAGNCAMLKPSEFTPHSSDLMKKIIEELFPPEEVAVFEGDAVVSQALMALPFNHIFFTGSPAVGKIVMKAAAEQLASVTLELGGKSPVVVDETADLDNAASKIMWIKSMNAGQICIAPDYLLVHEQVHDALVAKLGEQVKKFYGASPDARKQSPDYCLLVSDKHFGRVKGLFDNAMRLGAMVATGGNMDASTRFIEPTVLTHIPDEASIWEEEIFGPLLPVRTYKTLGEAIAYINAKPRPLAMYLFSNRKSTLETILADTRTGGVTVNDCGLHFYNANLPFGGVNNSGIGKSHGEAGFLEFSNQRGLNWQNRVYPVTNLLLPPYGSRLANWIKWSVLRWC